MRVQWCLNEVLWCTHEVSLSFHEILPVLHSSALILHPSVRQSVSNEPRYRAAIAAKKLSVKFIKFVKKLGPWGFQEVPWGFQRFHGFHVSSNEVYLTVPWVAMRLWWGSMCSSVLKLHCLWVSEWHTKVESHLLLQTDLWRN